MSYNCSDPLLLQIGLLLTPQPGNGRVFSSWWSPHPKKLELHYRSLSGLRKTNKLYCMHVASHNKNVFHSISSNSNPTLSFWCDHCLQTSIWLILMGNHMHLISLARQQETQTLPSGPALGMLNHDHKSKILYSSFLWLHTAHTLFHCTVIYYCQIHRQI